MADAGNGRFVWHELLTTDMGSAGKFFGKTMGWKTTPFDPSGSYHIFNAGKRGAGGLMDLPDEAKKMGAHPHWLSYIGVADVDESVRQATALGAHVVKAAADIPNAGRYAVLSDPQGAMFGVYSAPGAHDASTIDVDFSWHELPSTDPGASMAFYKKAFGFDELAPMDMGPELGLYHLFGWNGKQGGGMFKKMPNMPGPSAWLAYLRVPDAKKSAESIKKAGGTVINGPMEVPGGDWIAQAMDQQGAMFAVHSAKPAVPAAAPKAAAAKGAKASGAAKSRKAAPAKKAAPKKAAPKKAAPKKAAKKSTRKAAKKAAPVKKAAPAKKAAKKKSAKKKAGRRQ